MFFRLAGSKYWSKITAYTYSWFSKYHDEYVKFIPGYEEVSNHAIKTINLAKNMVALDVACGTGFLTLKIASKVREVVGIDIFKGQLTQLKISSTLPQIST